MTARANRLPTLLSALLLAGTLSGAVAAAGPAVEVEPDTTARVARVIDGDTVTLASGRVVRYIGIDAPEIRRRERGGWVFDPKPHALAAKAENRRLVEGEVVRLGFDRERTDRYGRLLAYVYVGDRFVNLHLVREGLARARSYPPNVRHQAELGRAEAAARSEGRGMWGAGEGPRPDVE